jgi:membrane-associated PAP2 superfamily phosphatase
VYEVAACRPTPALIYNWALEVSFASEKYVELPSYHYGMVFMKNAKKDRGKSMLWGSIGVSIGVFMGTYQIMRGQHYIGDTLVTAL